MSSNLTDKKITWSFNGKEAKREDVLDHISSGWHPLVNRLIDDLFELEWDGELAQIKEKFGGLRFYIEHGNDAIWDRIMKAENESTSTCEVCGTPGKLRTERRWVRCLCEEHNK